MSILLVYALIEVELTHPSYPNHLRDWCGSRLKSQLAYEFLKATFMYDPEKRVTARASLEHGWFNEEPRPTSKYVFQLHLFFSCSHR